MKMLSIFILLLLISLQAVSASERIDALIEEDAMASLEEIYLNKMEIYDNKELLLDVQSNLKKAKKGQAIYVQLNKIGGTLVLAAIVIGTYKAHFPLGMRLLLGSYLSMSGVGHGLIKLNLGDIQKINTDLLKAQAKIQLMEKDLDRQIRSLCAEDRRHQLCYMNFRK